MKYYAAAVAIFVCSYVFAQQPVIMNGWQRRADTIAVNIYFTGNSSYSGTNWNNWAVSNSGSQSKSNLIRKRDGSNSGIAVSLNNNQGSADNGSSYCTTPSSGFPTEVYRYALYMGGPMVFTFTNLDNSKKYDYVHLASRGTPTHNLTLSGQSKTSSMEAASNCTDKMQINGLVPSSGTIVVTITANTGTFAYSNAFYLIEH